MCDDIHESTSLTEARFSFPEDLETLEVYLVRLIQNRLPKGGGVSIEITPTIIEVTGIASNTPNSVHNPVKSNFSNQIQDVLLALQHASD